METWTAVYPHALFALLRLLAWRLMHFYISIDVTHDSSSPTIFLNLRSPTLHFGTRAVLAYLYQHQLATSLGLKYFVLFTQPLEQSPTMHDLPIRTQPTLTR